MSLEEIRSWSVDQVIEFFDQLNLGKYAADLRKEEVSGELLLDLLEHNSLGDLGMSGLHQGRLRTRIGIVPNSQGTAAPATAESKDAQESLSETTERVGAPVAAVAQKGEGAAAGSYQNQPENVAAVRTAGRASEGGAAMQVSTEQTEATHQRQSRAAHSPLFGMVASRDEGAICRLLAGRADPNVLDASGNPPLLSAIKSGEHNIVALLMCSRADPTRYTDRAASASNLLWNGDETMWQLVSKSPDPRLHPMQVIAGGDYGAKLAQKCRLQALQLLEESESLQRVQAANKRWSAGQGTLREQRPKDEETAFDSAWGPLCA